MRKRLFFILFILTGFHASAQICPGGSDYSSAVNFQDTWVMTCSNGTSCSGAVELDNRSTCEPTTAVDPCPPQPSGSNASRLGSDLWYKFVAQDTSVVINLIKRVSLMAAIQMFKDTTGCGDLQEMGVAYSSTPSNPVSFTRNNFIIGDTYVFRVFGHSQPVSQRTGVYCFCGSSGVVPSNVLPLNLISFKVQQLSGSGVKIDWQYTDAKYFSHFELERKIDEGSFETIATFKLTNSNASSFSYYDILSNEVVEDVQYRLKMVDINGAYQYSDIKSVFQADQAGYTFLHANQTLLKVSAERSTEIELLNFQGVSIKKIHLSKGLNEVSVSLPKGFYLLRDNSGSIQRFTIY